MIIPSALIDAVRSGRAVLFLGAGAALGARHPNGVHPPLGLELVKLLSRKFLTPAFEDYPLATVAELAISERGIADVQEFIRDIFDPFQPGRHHVQIATFAWRAIATTNYDLILERAYAAEDALQKLVPFTRNGQSFEQRMRDPRSVPYLKLHGCISLFDDRDCPLILTVDQYVNHRACRGRLFEKFEEMAVNYPVIYVGHSLADPDLRYILQEVSAKAGPRSYLVVPKLSDIESRYWESRRVSPLEFAFADFLSALDTEIPAPARHLAVSFFPTDNEPIRKHLRLHAAESLPQTIATLLINDVQYVYPELSSSKANPQQFYKGFFTDWSPIQENLDVRRLISDQILSEVFLVDEQDRRSLQELVVIKAHGGAGKSVLLKRLAWDAASDYDCLCLFVRDHGRPAPETLLELAQLTSKRLFLFVDNVADCQEHVEYVLKFFRRERAAITVIAAERFSEWNQWCDALALVQTAEYEVRYLSETDIDQLLVLLRRHHSLGYLQTLSPDDQRRALAQRAGRQLLVALHEATYGKPFEEIVADEYRSLRDTEAQSLYLTVCILNRFDVPVRAGLISRVHELPFVAFKERLFKPLDSIVFATYDARTRDMVYRARHPHVAEMLIETVLAEPQARFDEYVRLIQSMDVDYMTDRDALRQLLSGRRIREEFDVTLAGRQIFDIALHRAGDDVTVMQQAAIFEMRSLDGNFERAAELLERASKLRPKNRVVAHSVAELNLKRASRARTALEREKFRENAKDICRKLIDVGDLASYPYHTILKALLEELAELVVDADEPTLLRKVKETESILATAVQRFPDESFIHESEARFAEIIGNEPRSAKALRQAFSTNPKSPYIARRFAGYLEASGNVAEATAVMKQCVEANGGDRDANFYLASLLDRSGGDRGEIRHHFRRSFSRGDQRHAARFEYARLLYLEGEVTESRELFEELARAAAPPDIRDMPRRHVVEDGDRRRFLGSIARKEAGYAFIEAERPADRVFAPRKHTGPDDWDRLGLHDRVSFELAFNYRGPVATSVRKL